MKNLLLKIAITIWITSCSLNSWASQDDQTWLNVNATLKVDKWRVLAEYAPQLIHDRSTFGVGGARGGIGYVISEHSTVWVGYATQWTEFNTIEQQAWQGYTWTHNYGDSFNLEVRTRLEERFLPNNSDVSYRGRVRVRGEYSLPSYPDLSVIGSDEAYVNLNDNKNPQLPMGYNQNQIYVAIGYKVSNNIKLETGYLQQNIAGYNGAETQNNNIWMNYITMKF
jgi:hypothetical protein